MLSAEFLAMSWRNRITTPDGQVFDIPSTMNANECLAVYGGNYEADETRIIREWMQPDSTIVEIGCNIGFVGRYAFTEKLLDSGTYICVEPNPVPGPALRRNMERAERQCPGRRFEIVSAAIRGGGDQRVDVQFVVRKNQTSAAVGQIPHEKMEQIISVPSMSLTTLLRTYAPNGASLICDAEGAEIDMIFKDGEAFQHIRQIAIELHEPAFTGRAERPDIMLDRLKSLGFTCKARMGNTCYLIRGG
jgi:FkbM family methyltransferase